MPKSIVVFDEYVAAGATAYTSDRWNAVMSRHDEITIFAVVDDVQGTSGANDFDCWLDVSADGRLWLQRNDLTQALPPPRTAGTGDLFVSSMTFPSTLSGTTVLSFTDACLGVTLLGNNNRGPLLAFVRLAVRLGSTVGAHVRITYAGRGHAS
jgi:hypothetical protein